MVEPAVRSHRARRLRSVRARATTGAVLVVGLALLAGAAVLLAVLRGSYVESVRNPAQTRARDVAAALDRGVEADRLELEEGEDRFTQVIEGDRVVAASANVGSAAPLDDRTGVDISVPVGDPDDRWVIVTASAGPARTVVVGRELDPPLESVATAATTLALGIPLLLGLVGLTTWRVVGAALAPVEAIRTEVSSIGATDLARRVPVTATGDEVEELATTMNGMLDRLEAAQRSQRRFVSDASHELRSPLAAIRQHAEVAQAHPQRTSADALAGVVLAEESRLEALVEDLLLLARSDEGGLALRRGPVDLDDLALDEAGRAARDRVDLDLSGVGAARVDGDEKLLRRMLHNLVDNAARHAERRIRVDVAIEPGRAVVSVHDDGPGIAVEERQNVFERFVRLDRARAADTGGAGLGLAIVAEIVAAHGGDVAIADSSLGGVAVTVRLPAPREPGSG